MMAATAATASMTSREPPTRPADPVATVALSADTDCGTGADPTIDIGSGAVGAPYTSAVENADGTFQSFQQAAHWYARSTENDAKVALARLKAKHGVVPVYDQPGS